MTDKIDRNIETKLDDHGNHSDLTRNPGESLTNFKFRLLRLRSRNGKSDISHFIDGLCGELGLDQENIIEFTATNSGMYVEITQSQIIVSGYDENKIANIWYVNPDGFLLTSTISGVVNQLNPISGIDISYNMMYQSIPASVLEPQSSYMSVPQETVPRTNSWELGFYAFGQSLPGPVVSGSITWSDTENYRTYATTPSRDGEWSVSGNFITAYNIPTDFSTVSYKYNLLTSGNTFNAIGNGAGVCSLSNTEIQQILYTISGISWAAEDFANILIDENPANWGK